MSMTESEAKFWLDKLHGNILRDRFAKICTENEIIALIESKIAWMELEQYRAIGTVSEFRQLKEKATAKKVFLPFGMHSYKCPSCWKFVAHEVDDNCDLEATMADYCPYCGQKLDWSEGKE